MINYKALETDVSENNVIQRSLKYTSAAVKSFQAFKKPLVLDKGSGAYLWDVNGKKYIDFMGQNLSVSVGYDHPLVKNEAIKQMDQLMHSNAMYVHPQSAAYAEELVARFPKDVDWVVHLVNSGAEAVDLAVMMARVYTGNFHILALRNCYHGVGGTTLSLTAMHTFKYNIPPEPGILHVANPHPYRGIFGDATEEYLEEIDRTILADTNGKVAGFVVEPIQGFGGVVPQPIGYLKGASERIRAAGGLYIVDEIQTGVTRTGEHYWGFQREEVIPDIVCVAKGIGNGLPLAAVVVRQEIVDAMHGSKWFNTTASNPVNCAVGRAVLQAIDVDNTQQNAKAMGEILKKGLNHFQEKYDLIGSVRGEGLLVGAELVADRRTKEPASNEAGRIVEYMRENGVIIGQGGHLSNMLRFNPPLCIKKEDIEYMLDILDQAFKMS